MCSAFSHLASGSDFIDPSIPLRQVMGHPACLIKRIQLFANGQRTDDIDNYGRTVHLYTLLKPREWSINQANEGFEINDVGEFPFALPTSYFQEVLMAPTLVGLLLGCGKMLPPQLNLVLEIEFADAADAIRGASGIQNLRVLASQVTLGSALVESFNRVLLSGRSLVFSYPTGLPVQRSSTLLSLAPTPSCWAPLRRSGQTARRRASQTWSIQAIRPTAPPFWSRRWSSVRSNTHTIPPRTSQSIYTSFKFWRTRTTQLSETCA